MRYINELAPHTSEWEFLSQCSRETQSGRDYFVDRCSHLERLFRKIGLPLNEFYWFTSDDQLKLELKIDYEHFDQLQRSAKLIKKYLSKYFPLDSDDCFESIKIFDIDDHIEYDWYSYVRAFRNDSIELRLNIESNGSNYYFASPIYLDACLNYA